MNKIENKHNLQPWYVEVDAARLRRFGKTLEELGELQAVVARCIIQGIDEVDPSSGKLNRDRLEEEIADVYAQTTLMIKEFGLDARFIETRALDKMDQMATWEALVSQEDFVAQEDWQPPSDDFEWICSGD